MSHTPRKRFGQNFLQNPQIITGIIDAFNPAPLDAVIEIGPGQGAITRPLLKRLDHLTAIEIDRDLHAYLKQLPEAEGKLTLINEDALNIDYSQYGNHLRIIGNLPYNISTPLILHLLRYHSHIDDMCFMLQKEVVERLVASPGNKDYGRLSIIVQYHMSAEHLFNVPPDAFFPKPKVDSAIVRLVPYKQQPYPSVDTSVLTKVVAQAFSMRRKKLANNLKPLMSADELHQLDIDATQRPEQISIAEFVRIAKYITK